MPWVMLELGIGGIIRRTSSATYRNLGDIKFSFNEVKRTVGTRRKC